VFLLFLAPVFLLFLAPVFLLFLAPVFLLFLFFLSVICSPSYPGFLLIVTLSFFFFPFANAST
jgi:hypothetical protein